MNARQRQVDEKLKVHDGYSVKLSASLDSLRKKNSRLIRLAVCSLVASLPMTCTLKNRFCEGAGKKAASTSATNAYKGRQRPPFCLEANTQPCARQVP
jgi:hypothetical protein